MLPAWHRASIEEEVVMHRLTRARATVAVVLASAVGVAGPASIFAGDVSASTQKRHCIKYKTVKDKHGKKVKRCSKYSKK
jgi:hypothetical protein